MKENKTELKPCPFCGGEVDIENISTEDEQYYMVSCKKCGAAICFGDKSETQVGAIEAWNKRAFDYETANHISQFLQDAGYDDASKTVDCVFDLQEDENEKIYY